jgi:hypothetical protein
MRRGSGLCASAQAAILWACASGLAAAADPTPAAAAETAASAAAQAPQPALSASADPADAAKAAATAACPVPAAAGAMPPILPAPAVFQGLPWGADERRIAERFGARLVPATCDAETVARAERDGEWCESPTVPIYEVAGVPFVLTLHLDAAERRLVRVTLSHSAEHGRGGEPRWSDHHRVLRRLLAQRYGGPESSDLQHEGTLTTAQARWRTGLALIDLVSTFQPRAGATPARERVQITYQSPLNGEAAKL